VPPRRSSLIGSLRPLPGEIDEPSTSGAVEAPEAGLPLRLARLFAELERADPVTFLSITIRLMMTICLTVREEYVGQCRAAEWYGGYP
jgi:hypothetical protein